MVQSMPGSERSSASSMVFRTQATTWMPSMLSTAAPTSGAEREAGARRLKAELVEQRAGESVRSHEGGEAVAFGVLLTGGQAAGKQAAPGHLGE